jgi:hypothetical protein
MLRRNSANYAQNSRYLKFLRALFSCPHPKKSKTCRGFLPRQWRGALPRAKGRLRFAWPDRRHSVKSFSLFPSCREILQIAPKSGEPRVPLALPEITASINGDIAARRKSEHPSSKSNSQITRPSRLTIVAAFTDADTVAPEISRIGCTLCNNSVGSRCCNTGRPASPVAFTPRLALLPVWPSACAVFPRRTP